MKNTLKFLFAIMAIAIVFVSCEETATEPQPPTITLDGTGNNIAVDSEVTIGSTFSIQFTATPNSESSSKLVGLNVTRTFNNTPTTVIDSTLDKETSITVALTLEAQSSTGTERIVIEVEDKDGEMAEKVLNITYVEGAVNLTEHSIVLLGAQGNSEPSCASLETGTRYSISGDEAKNNAASVDIVHYNGANDVAIYAPSNSAIQGVSSYGIDSWSTQNDTKLSITSLTETDFNNIETDEDLSTAGTASGDIAGQLTVGKVVVFETAGGKKGVFLVTDLTDATDGSVTISVKVEP